LKALPERIPMAKFKETNKDRVFAGKIEFGKDLLKELTDFCTDNKIESGRIEAVGAVQKARIAFYDQEKRSYNFLTFDSSLEITNLNGNISMKDGGPFVHAHITLADAAGKAYGGHLAPGTIVFACEFIIETFKGAVFERHPDKETGLSLWRI
jgi:uncharacterized protein